MAYDGTDFVVMDDEVVSDDGTYSAPVDAYAEQRLRANAYYLTQGRAPAILTLYQGDEDVMAEDSDYPNDRPWVSLNDYATVVRVPIWMSTGLSQIAATLLYRCEVPFPAINSAPTVGGDMQYQMRVRGPGGRVKVTQGGTLSRTQDASLGQREAIYNMTTLTCTMEEYRGTPGYGTFEFRVISGLGADSGTNATLNGGAFELETASDGDFGFPTNPPRDTSPDLYAFFTADGSQFEPFSVRTNGGGPESIAVYPDTGTQFVSGKSVDLYWVTYMQCRSMQIDLVYGADSIAPQPLNGLAAKQPVRSRQFFSHAIHPTTLYHRPRHLAFGPPGYRPTREESWPARYHTRWPIATGAASGTLADESIIVDADGAARIEIVLDLIATVYTFTAGSDPGTSKWDITASIQEFDTSDTTWRTPTTIATRTLDDVIIETHAAPKVISSYFFASGGTRFQYSKTLLHNGQSDPEAWQWPFKEGQLYDEDSKLIQRVTISLDASSITDIDASVRVLVSASYTASSLDGFSNQGVFGTPTTGDRIHLTCVGYTITQTRQV